MLGVLAGIIGVVAIGAWVVAVTSALSIAQLAPAGQRMSTWFTLGWWRFDKVRVATGPAADPHIKRYVRAFMVFFVAVLAAMGIGIALTFTAANGPADERQASEPERINDPRVIAVGIAEGDALIVPRPGSATMRSAAMLS